MITRCCLDSQVCDDLEAIYEDGTTYVCNCSTRLRVKDFEHCGIGIIDPWAET